VGRIRGAKGLGLLGIGGQSLSSLVLRLPLDLINDEGLPIAGHFPFLTKRGPSPPDIRGAADSAGRLGGAIRSVTGEGRPGVLSTAFTAARLAFTAAFSLAFDLV
jgi:hypothetical protein